MLPSGNLYQNSKNLPKRVENPGFVFVKSLPKQRETAEKGRESRVCFWKISTQISNISHMGRESQYCHPEISTQTAKNSRKGRESPSCHPEISTQTAKICRKGRETQYHRPEISTQTAKISRKGIESRLTSLPVLQSASPPSRDS